MWAGFPALYRLRCSAGCGVAHGRRIEAATTGREWTGALPLAQRLRLCSRRWFADAVVKRSGRIDSRIDRRASTELYCVRLLCAGTLFARNICTLRCIIASIVQRQAFDAGYLQRLAQSDPETERDFTEYFSELLTLKLRSRLRSADAIADVIQETFLRVFHALRQRRIDTPEALGAFVNSTCNNVLFEVYRHESRITEPPAEEASSEAGPDAVLASEEQRRDVLQILSAMPDKDRQILRSLFFDEREKNEICRNLGVDRGYLRVLVHRAKSRFRDDWLKRFATKSTSTSPLR
jgi:RNA polymerase sigma-70 factor, ECF subfamily